MKNILKTNIKLLSVALAFTSIIACTDDDLPGLDTQPKGTVSTTVTSISLAEGETAVIPFTISQAISKASQFKIEKVSGSISQTDIAIGDADTDADTGIPHVGYEITVAPYATDFEIPVRALVDNLSLECGDQLTESGTYRITAAGVRTLLTPSSDGFLVDINVTAPQTDWPLTTYTWTLELNDSYGDGWNGASIDVLVDGAPAGSYTLANGDNDTISIPITTGGGPESTYSISFSGGDWDGEITYTLIDPDGNTWSDGPSPNIGEITSGTIVSVCP